MGMRGKVSVHYPVYLQERKEKRNKRKYGRGRKGSRGEDCGGAGKGECPVYLQERKEQRNKRKYGRGRKGSGRKTVGVRGKVSVQYVCRREGTEE